MENTHLATVNSTIGRTKPGLLPAVLGLVFSGIGSAASASSPLIEARPQQSTSEDMLEPLAVDAEMRRWLQSSVVERTDPGHRLAEIAAALLDRRDGLDEVKFPEPTPTAVEAFRSRSANCVGFAMLFVALAREADVPAFFVVVPEQRDGSRRGDLRVIEDHLAAGAMIDGRQVLYDLGGRIRRPRRAVQPVSDLTALAIFQSNRGAELLATGRVQEAVGRLELATELDPELATGWANLGVTKRRLGDLDGAEQAYRRALELEPQHPGARGNLVNLLHQNGRLEEALILEAEPASTYPLITLSRAAARLERGELEAARSLYLRALALSR